MTQMKLLYSIFPKDICYMIDDYAKDKTQYDKVMGEFKDLIRYYCGGCLDINDYCYWREHQAPHKRNITILYHLVVLRILLNYREDRQRRINNWYADIKRQKKPHGKRLSTIKSKEKDRKRLGKKNTPL